MLLKICQGVLAEDSDKGENGEIKENLDGSRVYDGTSVDLTPSTDGDGARSYIVEIQRRVMF